MNRLSLALGAALLLATAAVTSTPARAQSVAVVVSDCSTVSGIPVGSGQPLVEDTTGKLCGSSGSTVGAVSDSIGPDTFGTFTNPTGTTSIQALTEVGTNAYSTTTVTIRGTYANASAVFEKSDDDTLTNWYPVQCSQEGQGIIETGYSSLTNTSRMWQCNTQGSNAFRVRSTSVDSGTANILISPSGMPTVNGATVSIGPSTDAITSGSLTVVDSGSTTTTGANNAPIVTGTATAGSTVNVPLSGRTATQTLITGTWSGVISFEGSMDGGTTWTPFSAHVRGAAPAVATTTGNGTYLANTSGMTNYRVRFTTKTSGTPTIAFAASSEEGVVYIANAIKLLGIDNTSQSTIKAASTAALSTDTSLVTALNPNTPLPAGTNVLGHVINDASAAVIGHVITDTTSTTAATQATASSLLNKPYGAATTTPPSYSTGTDNPLSLGLAGGLRVGELQGAAQGTVFTRPGVIAQGQNPLDDSGVPIRTMGTNLNLAPGGSGILDAGLTGQLDDVAPTSVSEGNQTNVRVSPAKVLYAEEDGRPFVHISSATTATPKSAEGFLHTVTVNTPVASETITIYDNTAGSGTIIAALTLPSTITGIDPFTVTYDARFATGLTIVTSSTADLTVTYR